MHGIRWVQEWLTVITAHHFVGRSRDRIVGGLFGGGKIQGVITLGGIR
jgi:hypothetical protein